MSVSCQTSAAQISHASGMTDTRYRLHYAPDNASLIIRLALLEMDQPFETVLVDRSVRGHKAPDYLALNPNGLIPVLETPDGVMFETGAILLWLADRHGALAPPPHDPARAAFLKWLFFVSNTLHVAARITFYPEQYVGADAAAQIALRRHIWAEFTTHLDKLETLAAEGHGWFGGDTPSVLEFYICCIIRWRRLYPADQPPGFSLANWPRLHAIATRLEGRSSVEIAAKAEGLGPTPFTAPIHPNPPEGSAT